MYSWDIIEPPPGRKEFDESSWSSEELERAKGYIADGGLVDAMLTARLLQQPLLLTGEPGTGKTHSAYYASWKLGLAPPLMFETKSTSTARDLFYVYDTLGHFHDAQLERDGKKAIDPRGYMTYNALGIAILRTNEREAVSSWVPNDFEHDGPQRSVVLIDEVDKAPRDFPNDILNEIEYMYFKIPEFRDLKTHKVPRIESSKDLRPFVILTSNSEKHLPEPFLRRCVYYNIPFPDREQLIEIIMVRLRGSISDSEEIKHALDLFFRLRERNSGIEKRPSTAELLKWLEVLHDKSKIKGRTIRAMDKQTLESTLCVLLKSDNDRKIGKAILDRWKP